MANQVHVLDALSFQVLPSAARTAVPDTHEYEGAASTLGISGQRQASEGTPVGLVLVIDATAITLTPSVVVKVEGVDRFSGKTWSVLDSVAITAVGTTVLRVHPALTAAANTTAKDALPPVFRVTATHADADSITYSISGHLVY